MCIHNPNRVKAKKRDRGWWISLEPDHHRHRAGGKNRSVFGSEKKKKREQDPFGSENREGSRHSSRTLTQELNRSSSELGKESVSGKRTISDELKQRKAIGSTEQGKKNSFGLTLIQKEKKNPKKEEEQGSEP